MCTDKQVKIEKYRASLQHDLRQLCRTSPTGARWARLQDSMQFATLQWPMVQEHIAKSKKSSQKPTKVGGKRKASGSAEAKGLGRSSKPKLGASGKMFDEQYQKDMAVRLRLLVALAWRTRCPMGIFKGSRCRRAGA
jgi:hypothetical protein